MDNPLFFLGFLSVFHVIGGGAVGATLHWLVKRGLRAGVVNSLFMLVWGSMFGCMPLAFGLQPLAEGEIPWLFPAQLAVLGAAVVISFFFIEQIQAKFFRPPFFLMAFGGIFAAVGLVAKSATDSSSEDPLTGLLVGGIFFVVGAAIFYAGWWQFLQERK